MKVKTFHNMVNYTSLAVLAGSTIAIAAAPTTLTVTVTAVALGIMAGQAQFACRQAIGAVRDITEESKDEYLTKFKGEFTLERAVVLATAFAIGILCCVQLAELLTPPKFAVRTPI